MKTVKTKYKKITKNMAALCVVALAVAGCKQDFIVPSHDKIADEVLWQDPGAVGLFLNGTYLLNMPDYPLESTPFIWEFASDESIGSVTDGSLKKVMGIGSYIGVNDVKIIANKPQGNNRGDNRYFDIARCNLGLYNVPTSPFTKDIKDQYMGQFFALRAIAYFELTRLYGGVPLNLKPQDPTNVDYSGRKSAKECINAIVSDLDSAAARLANANFRTAVDWGRLDRLAALSLKGRVLLTWASPQFNPVNDGLHPYDATRWTTALKANEEAYNLCVNSGLKLMPYANIFTTEGPGNTEAIIVKEYSSTLEKKYNGVETRVRPGGVAGGSPSDYYVASQAMLDAYPMADGTPALASDGVTPINGYDPDMYFLNRDPRFAQTIAYNGAQWKLSGIANRTQWNYTAEIDGGGGKPFYCKRFSNPDVVPPFTVVGDKGAGGVDWIELRFAEVLMNYAECLNETGDLTASKNLIRDLRKTRGIVIGANDYGLNLATNKDQMRDLIMNERMVEFAFEGKRGWDLRRTRRLDKLNGKFLYTYGEQIYPIDTKNAVYIAKKATLEEIIPGQSTLRRRDTLQVSKRSSYRYFFQHPTVSTGANRFGDLTNPIAVPANQCYFWPLPTAFLQSSPTLDQTIGWENGTFDPLKN
ncbi:RagB/SusD family nutrient uptake outer membrane protein [Mucilaginibacter sp. HMF5004]|uniref:RagB/SusD family nutrient uptake outer membrane protein n=1 Tax=Mucilaginibacter rivuli TaxID=2857527 RepID=UPI001C5CF536|nr:RagB/SusD family nutrient uptake outer membrane protein [Mucilaginibacter rivuli]MBW4891879.1 RagB/SusD family nutrient uptake outer membrane protein [Mucilaginibacter rivuli]